MAGKKKKTMKEHNASLKKTIKGKAKAPTGGKVKVGKKKKS